MITAIDLKNCLQRGVSSEGGLFIITNFNKLDIAFHVDAVKGIHRVSWENIIKPGATVSNAEESISTGIVKLNNRLVIILDFEKIVTDINPETGSNFDCRRLSSSESFDCGFLKAGGIRESASYMQRTGSI